MHVSHIQLSGPAEVGLSLGTLLLGGLAVFVAYKVLTKPKQSAIKAPSSAALACMDAIDSTEMDAARAAMNDIETEQYEGRATQADVDRVWKVFKEAEAKDNELYKACSGL